MTPFNPDSWQDVFVLIILGFFTMTTATLPVVISHRKQSRAVGEIREQVSNSHSTNLRDDIDELAKSVREGHREIRVDISDLRGELRTERVERIEGDRLRAISLGG